MIDVPLATGGSTFSLTRKFAVRDRNSRELTVRAVRKFVSGDLLHYFVYFVRLSLRMACGSGHFRQSSRHGARCQRRLRFRRHGNRR